MTRLIFGTLALLLSGAVWGQPAAPAFDVTSVRVNKRAHVPQVGQPPPRDRFGCSGNRFESIDNLLWRPIAWAYNVRFFQVSGMPRWAEGSPEAFFDIQAVTEAPVSVEQCRVMVQTLLADRFKLVVHRETKELPVYALVLGKNGSKLKEASDLDPSTPEPVGGFVRIEKSTTRVSVRWSMAQLVDWLSLSTTRIDQRNVVDRTGLKGIYEFSLMYELFPEVAERLGRHDKPDVFTAVQEQLGLKLESRNEPFEVVVIDHLERPSEN
ncbi:MAG TPA: TIGR03435 family protein [Bryobacteraceae bacterium]